MVAYWKTLHSDEGAEFDKEYVYDAEDITPMITYGTNPGMGIKIEQPIPNGENKSESEKSNDKKSLEYMGSTPMNQWLVNRLITFS
jgi:3-isopropylmalate/(R)-2-methylmalate dehydratase large subunit